MTLRVKSEDVISEVDFWLKVIKSRWNKTLTSGVVIKSHFFYSILLRNWDCFSISRFVRKLGKDWFGG
jgi:hypothetical protein